MSHKLCDIFLYRYLSPPSPLQDRSQAAPSRQSRVKRSRQLPLPSKPATRALTTSLLARFKSLRPRPQANPKTAQGNSPPNSFILSSAKQARQATTPLLSKRIFPAPVCTFSVDFPFSVFKPQVPIPRKGQPPCLQGAKVASPDNNTG